MLNWLLYNPANICTIYEYESSSELVDVINSNPVLGSEESIDGYEINDDFLFRT